MTRQPSLSSHVSRAHVVSITMRGGGGTPQGRQEHSAPPRFIYFMPPRQHGDIATTASGPCRCLYDILIHPPPCLRSSIHRTLFFACVSMGASDTDGKSTAIPPRLQKSPSALSPLAVSFECTMSAFSTALSPARFPAGSPAPP